MKSFWLCADDGRSASAKGWLLALAAVATSLGTGVLLEYLLADLVFWRVLVLPALLPGLLVFSIGKRVMESRGHSVWKRRKAVEAEGGVTE